MIISFIKEVFFDLACVFGSLMFVCLTFVGMLKIIYILIDNLQIMNIVRKAIIMYAKAKNPHLNIKKS